MAKTKTETFDTGAKRSKLKGGYFLIPIEGLRRLAARYVLGSKYGINNWKKGMPASVIIDHMMEHLVMYASGDRSDDHIAGVIWGGFALCYFEENMPEMIDLDIEGVSAENRHRKTP